MEIVRQLRFTSLIAFFVAVRSGAQVSDVERRLSAVDAKVVAWHRDIHQHPELSFQETRTAALVASELKRMGLEVRTGVGGNGVVGVLRGTRPGPGVAIRAEMDALPVTEVANLPYKSTVRATYNGQDVGVMHACGHDSHVAMTLGAAEVLSGMRDRIAGTVTFLFQPAEESGPIGGAGPMIDAGALENPHVDAVFGIHVGPGRSGVVTYHAGASQAASDNLRIVVHGKQTHAAMPSAGVDPIVVGAQIVLGLQTVVSRQIDLTTSPAIVTIGAFNGGVRQNIIPDSVVMIGTIRTLDEGVRREVHTRVKRVAEEIARSGGATANVSIQLGYPVTVNDPALLDRMLPTITRVAGANRVEAGRAGLAADDFGKLAQRAPGLMLGLGVTPPNVDLATAPSNHSPLFEVDEPAMAVGTRVLVGLALDYLSGKR